ncbi:MAG: trimethylamine methyltransferase family protein, partial [Rhodospirillaceae bacterium]|nr:trimethylamine methyltransferase family protein [Rhodospirillaceae bacterium]
MPDAEGHQDTHRRRRKGHSPRDRAADEQGLPQLPWQQVRNPYPPMRILSDDQVEAIHQTSLRILEELGIELMSPEARAVCRAAGADVDEASGTVRLDRELVAEALATTQASFTLTPRNPDHAVVLGGDHVTFGLVAGPPNVHDCLRGRRRGNIAD